MKKKTSKRLKLEASTIRTLAVRDLRRANGGAPTDDETPPTHTESSGTITMS